MREMMKLEKERRVAELTRTAAVSETTSQGETPAAALARARTAAAAGGGVGVVKTAVPLSAAPPEAAPVGSLSAATRTNEGIERVAPLKTAAGSSCSSTAPACNMPEPKKPRVNAEKDALAMPPPIFPGKSAKAAVADALASMAPSLPAAEVLKGSPSVPAVSAVSTPTSGVLVADPEDNDPAPGEATAVAEGKDELVEEEAEEAPAGLPIGFFDDPDLDAKVRGAEAPSARTKRVLEEGLKKFEKEMVVETERAEETRHDLDEEKYEKAFEEEQEFQFTLVNKLQKLKELAEAKRKAARESVERAKVEEESTATKSSANVAEEDDDDSDSGSDVEFDWRAKGFG